MPPPINMPINCVWGASIVNYHKYINWTPTNSQKWGTFLLKGFNQFNKMENKSHVIIILENKLNYTLEGPMAVNEIST